MSFAVDSTNSFFDKVHLRHALRPKKRKKNVTKPLLVFVGALSPESFALTKIVKFPEPQLVSESRLSQTGENVSNIVLRN